MIPLPLLTYNVCDCCKYTSENIARNNTSKTYEYFIQQCHGIRSTQSVLTNPVFRIVVSEAYFVYGLMYRCGCVINDT